MAVILWSNLLCVIRLCTGYEDYTVQTCSQPMPYEIQEKFARPEGATRLFVKSANPGASFHTFP